MGRGRVSAVAAGVDPGRASPTRRRKAAPGLRVVERDGHWHIYGTLRAAGRSQSIRKGTGLAATPENRDAAETIRLDTERQFRDRVVHGKHSSLPVAIAAEKFLDRPDKPVGPTDTAKIREITRKFGPRLLAEITDEEWNDFIDARMRGRSAATRERYLNALMAFLNWCRAKKRRWLVELPEFERNAEARRPKHRRARRVAELTPELIELMVEHAAPHLAGQMAAMWATGGRGLSVLHGCRLCDYVAAEGREQLTFHDTKNGDPVVASVHPAAARIMRRYLAWRGQLWDREAPLFLTDSREPYVDTGGEWSFQNKTAWRAMRRRTIKTLRARAARQARQQRRGGDRSAAMETVAWAKQQGGLILQITPHWFRHHLATFMLSTGADLRSVMEQGGWRKPDILLGYAHDVPERRRAHVNRMAVDTSFARDFSMPPKSVENQ